MNDLISIAIQPLSDDDSTSLYPAEIPQDAQGAPDLKDIKISPGPWGKSESADLATILESVQKSNGRDKLKLAQTRLGNFLKQHAIKTNTIRSQDDIIKEPLTNIRINKKQYSRENIAQIFLLAIYDVRYLMAILHNKALREAVEEEVASFKPDVFSENDSPSYNYFSNAYKLLCAAYQLDPNQAPTAKQFAKCHVSLALDVIDKRSLNISILPDDMAELVCRHPNSTALIDRAFKKPWFGKSYQFTDTQLVNIAIASPLARDKILKDRDLCFKIIAQATPEQLKTFETTNPAFLTAAFNKASNSYFWQKDYTRLLIVKQTQAKHFVNKKAVKHALSHLSLLAYDYISFKSVEKAIALCINTILQQANRFKIDTEPFLKKDNLGYFLEVFEEKKRRATQPESKNLLHSEPLETKHNQKQESEERDLSESFLSEWHTNGKIPSLAAIKDNTIIQDMLFTPKMPAGFFDQIMQKNVEEIDDLVTCSNGQRFIQRLLEAADETQRKAFIAKYPAACASINLPNFVVSASPTQQLSPNQINHMAANVAHHSKNVTSYQIMMKNLMIRKKTHTSYPSFQAALGLYAPKPAQKNVIPQADTKPTAANNKKPAKQIRMRPTSN